ncbi:hypothetical protein [Bradyrhizobium tunisiense]
MLTHLRRQLLDMVKGRDALIASEELEAARCSMEKIIQSVIADD